MAVAVNAGFRKRLRKASFIPGTEARNVPGRA
jgi:hypothetical protein